MMVATMLLILIGLVGCSPTFSLRVPEFSTPIGNTFSEVCWVEVKPADAMSIRSATFHSDAVYDAAFAVTDVVEIQFYGRAHDPLDECTPADDSADIVLSEPFELEQRTSQAIEVGGAQYGADLADLVNRQTFWLGASAKGNVGIGETVTFRNGRISVAIW